MRRPLLLTGLGLALLLASAGCARRDASHGAPGPVLRSAPVDAALVTADFGWVLTADQLLLTRDGGTTLAPVEAAVPGGTTRAALFRDADQGWVAAAKAGAVTVARTADGGRTWAATDIPTNDEFGALRIAFGDARHGVLMARIATSTAFSRADLFTTADGGATWTARTAPVAGPVSVQPDGRIWLAGGVRQDQLYLSTSDGREWTRAGLEVGKATVTAVSPPAGGVLPVTVTEAGRASVALLTSGDGGGTWTPAGSVPVEHPTGPGVAAPVAVVDSELVVAEPTGERIRRTANRAGAGSRTVSEVQPSGLPTGVQRLTFANRTAGWALASSGTCAGNKQNCSTTTTVVATRDGGTTWRQVAQWRQQIN